MSKPTLIGSVARGMTLEKYATLQEQAERMRAVYARERGYSPTPNPSPIIREGQEREVIGEGSNEVELCADYGRPEYRSLVNAKLKHEPYVKLVNWRRNFQAEMMLRLARRQKVKDEALDAAWEGGLFYVHPSPDPSPIIREEKKREVIGEGS